METTRRKLLTLLSSIPALGFLGIAGKAEAKYVPVKDTLGNPSSSGMYVKAPGWEGWVDKTDDCDSWRTHFPETFGRTYYLSVEADPESFKSGHGAVSPMDGQIITLRYDKKKARWILCCSVKELPKEV